MRRTCSQLQVCRDALNASNVGGRQVHACIPARPPGGGGGAAADDVTATGGNSGAASVVNSVGAGGRQRLPANEQTVLHAYASLHEANTVALDAEHLGGGVDAVVEVVEEAEGAAAALREDAQRALASAAEAAASGPPRLG